ncbi:MAG TPA: glycoside hydrolase family 75 protein [Candidatus Acidoferrales bacterium]|nr:glycoside hydrolase family 75 protein [Candidatus Acidoferrales bacterium]
MKPTWAVVFVAALLPAAVAIARPGGQADKTESGATSADIAPKACPRTLLASFDPDKGEFFGHDVPIWSLGDGSAIMFRSGMTIDADGAPNAYSPDNTGLDDLSNAGMPGHWDGIVTDHGEPFVQGPDDPFPGFYISQTALVDWSKERTDPARYVDASKIPYIVLPGDLSRQFGARLGDFAVVVNIRRGIAANAIFADIGTLGEGSIALADALGIWSNAREGGTRGGILYVVYPGSGNRHPRSLDEINSETDKIFQQWGGMEQLNSCQTGLDAAQPQLVDRSFH